MEPSPQWIIIGISGVTNGGKTTLAKSLYQFFKDPKNKEFFGNMTIKQVEVLYQDDYFLPDDHPQQTRVDAINHVNYELITALDMDKLCYDLKNILNRDFVLYNTKQIQDSMQIEENFFGERYAPTPVFEAGKRVTFPKAVNILLLEGFLIFNHPMTLDLCNIKFHLHLPYERCKERRDKRSYDPPDVLGYFEMIVWPYYEKHFQEYAGRPDITYLNGELAQERIFKFVLDAMKNYV